MIVSTTVSRQASHCYISILKSSMEKMIRHSPRKPANLGSVHSLETCKLPDGNVEEVSLHPVCQLSQWTRASPSHQHLHSFWKMSVSVRQIMKELLAILDRFKKMEIFRYIGGTTWMRVILWRMFSDHWLMSTSLQPEYLTGGSRWNCFLRC